MRFTVITLFSLLVILSFTSCEDHESDIYGYNGDWNLTSVSGGFTGGGTNVPWDNMSINDNELTLYDGEFLVLRAYMNFGFMDEFGFHEVSMDFDFIADNSIIVFDAFEDKALNIDQYGLLHIDDGCCDLFVYSFSRN